MQASNDPTLPPHLLETYRSLVTSVLDSCEALKQKKGESPELEARIKETLSRWVTFCEENHARLFPDFQQTECEDALKVSMALAGSSNREEFKTQCDGFQRQLNAVISRAVQTLLKPENAQLAPIQTMPPDLLRLNFALLPSLKDIFSWSRTSRQFRTLSHELASWKTSRAFQRILKESHLDLERKNFRSYLIRLGQKEETKHFARQLACEFFNRSSDEVLRLFLDTATPQERDQFFALIDEGLLIRESISLSSSRWIHQEPYALTWLVARLPELKSVTLSGNPTVTDDDILALAPLAQLRSLQLSGCRNITGKGLEQISAGLEKLELGNCESLLPAHFASLSRFTLLTELDLSKNRQLRNPDLKFLASLPVLTKVNLSTCIQLSDDGLQHLSHLGQSLRSLNLSELPLLRGEVLRHLAGCGQMEYLNLNQCTQLQDAGMVHLVNLIKMRELNLNQCNRLTGGCVMNFKRMVQLKQLSCRGWNKFEEGDLNELVCLENLESLDLGYCKTLKADALAPLGSLMHLRTLKLDDCALLDGTVIAHLLPLKDSLHNLDLCCCPKMKGAALQKIGELVNLRTLNLSGCIAIGDADLVHLNPLAQLRELHLAGLDKLTGSGFAAMAGCTQLAALDVNGSESFSDQNIQHLKMFARLSELNAIGCPITPEGVETLRNERQTVVVKLMVLKRGGKSKVIDTLCLDPVKKPSA